jgi:hypothetical protein
MIQKILHKKLKLVQKKPPKWGVISVAAKE